jgi:OOP family OmpA-OmpF porin
MKRKLLASAIALTMLTTTASAQTEPDYESWVGGFVQYYSPDQHKPNPFPFNYLDDGHTFGAEAGFRFDPKWAVRFELSRIFLDMTGDFRPGNGDDGTMIGADVMYFLDDDVAYLFGGARNQSILDSYRMASYGVGKHWEVSDNVRVITEVARYFDKSVNKYRGNYRIRNFSCWDQYLCMLFAQLTHRESLRDIEICLRAFGKNALSHWD